MKATDAELDAAIAEVFPGADPWLKGQEAMIDIHGEPTPQDYFSYDEEVGCLAHRAVIHGRRILLIWLLDDGDDEDDLHRRDMLRECAESPRLFFADIHPEQEKDDVLAELKVAAGKMREAGWIE